jgi:hypothetical protein
VCIHFAAVCILFAAVCILFAALSVRLMAGHCKNRPIRTFGPGHYGTELTKEKKVSPDTFARMSGHYSEREICEIVWLVASEHFYNMSNIGLNIHSDMLCDISRMRK